MDSKTIYIPSTFTYPAQLLEELQPLINSQGKIGSRKIKRAVAIIEKYNLPHLDSFPGNEKVMLVVLGWEDFGTCKMCSTKLNRVQYNKGAKYCGLKCYKADPDGAALISKVKTELYADKQWKAKTESKKKSTCMENHGVPYPMQKQELHEKQQHALGVCKDYKGFQIRGFEDKFIDWCEAHGIDITTDLQKSPRSFRYFDPNKNKTRTYHPDFYVASMNVFVEVKSSYTISEKCSTAGEIEHKLAAVREQGYKIILAVMERSGTISFPDHYNISVSDVSTG